MNTVQELLRDADPLRREPLPSADERERVRRLVLAAPTGPPERFGRRDVLLAGAALLVSGAVGAKLWSGDVVHAAVRFEVRLAERAFALGLTEARIGGSAEAIYLHQEVVVTNEDVLATRVVSTEAPSRFNIAVTFSTAGGEKMRQATAGHIGEPLAILIDGEVVAAPTLHSPIMNEAVINGDYSQAEAERLARGIVIR